MKAINPVKKHMHKASCYGKIEPNKRSKLLDDAEHRESLETILEAEIGGKSLNINEEEN